MVFWIKLDFFCGEFLIEFFAVYTYLIYGIDPLDLGELGTDPEKNIGLLILLILISAVFLLSLARIGIYFILDI